MKGFYRAPLQKWKILRNLSPLLFLRHMRKFKQLAGGISQSLAQLHLEQGIAGKSVSSDSESITASICPTQKSQRFQPPRNRLGAGRGAMPTFQWDMGPTSGAATQPGSIHGPTANINMVGGGVQTLLGMAPMHPVLLGLWRNMKKPKFSGLPKDAAQFMRDWTEVETIIQTSSSYPVSDFALLLELRDAWMKHHPKF